MKYKWKYKTKPLLYFHFQTIISPGKKIPKTTNIGLEVFQKVAFILLLIRGIEFIECNKDI